MNRKCLPVLLAIGCLAINVAQSQETMSFTNKLSAGITLTDGNSKTLQANASFITEGEKAELGSIRAGIEANYGEATVKDEKDTTVNNARAFANAKKKITPRTFGYLDASILRDDIAEIDYRLAVGPGLGVYLVKNEKMSFSVETGPSYITEKVDGASCDYLALRIAERIDFALSTTAKIWQSAEYLPKPDDFDDYLMNAELGIEATMTTRLNLRLVLQDKYDNVPAAGLKQNDLALIAGISLSL